MRVAYLNAQTQHEVLSADLSRTRFSSIISPHKVMDLPGLQELKGAGLLDANLPPDFEMPLPRGGDDLTADEDPLDGDEQTPLEMHLPEGIESTEETPSD